MAFLLPAVALAYHHGGHRGHPHRGSSHQAVSIPVVTPTPPTPPVSQTPPVVPVNGSEKSLQAYTTGYSYWDNTPPGSADISNSVIHQKAGGTGTYADPITLAVGHSISGSTDTLDYPAGTRFYFPFLKKYVIVEDTCGDGNSPQNGPCHTGYQGKVWLDVYVGKGSSKASSDACMDAITEVHTVIQNPASTYPTVAGDIASGCQQF